MRTYPVVTPLSLGPSMPASAVSESPKKMMRSPFFNSTCFAAGSSSAALFWPAASASAATVRERMRNMVGLLGGCLRVAAFLQTDQVGDQVHEFLLGQAFLQTLGHRADGNGALL